MSGTSAAAHAATIAAPVAASNAASIAGPSAGPSAATIVTPSRDAAASPTRLLRAVLAYNLHPEATLHPSWLPPEWPVRRRAEMRGWAADAQQALGAVLRARGVFDAAPDWNFDRPVKRLLLMDPPSLRRLAYTASLCAHAPLLRPRRGPLATPLRRQAARLGDGALAFVLERAPQPTELRMSARELQEHPAGAGRVLAERGYRLLLGLIAREGKGVGVGVGKGESDIALRRLQRMLPRRLAALAVPALTDRQAAQLEELMLACIVPERFARWDWLF